MSELSKERNSKLRDLRDELMCWQGYYDPVEDKEQHEMFILAADAVAELLALRKEREAAVPEGLHHETASLVQRFATALAEKLYKAEQKYGRSTDWMKPDWYDDCLQSLWEHIEKGDPRDVAAYCAFMWHHGWVTTDYDRNAAQPVAVPEGLSLDDAIKLLQKHVPISDAQCVTVGWEACRAAMLVAAPDFREISNSSTSGWIKCSERLPDIGEEVAVYCPGRDGCGKVTALSRLITHTADNSYYWGDGYVGGKTHLPESISHWQPLPVAPGKEG